MVWDSIVAEFKKSIDPRFPGLGKDPKLGFAVGALLGAFGVGLYLRSVGDFLLSFVVCILLAMLFDSYVTTVMCWLLCGCWVHIRIKMSERRFAAHAQAA